VLHPTTDPLSQRDRNIVLIQPASSTVPCWLKLAGGFQIDHLEQGALNIDSTQLLLVIGGKMHIAVDIKAFARRLARRFDHPRIEPAANKLLLHSGSTAGKRTDARDANSDVGAMPFAGEGDDRRYADHRET